MTIVKLNSFYSTKSEALTRAICICFSKHVKMGPCRSQQKTIYPKKKVNKNSYLSRIRIKLLRCFNLNQSTNKQTQAKKEEGTRRITKESSNHSNGINKMNKFLETIMTTKFSMKE